MSNFDVENPDAGNDKTPPPERTRTVKNTEVIEGCCDAHGGCLKCTTGWFAALWALVALVISGISLGFAVITYVLGGVTFSEFSLNSAVGAGSIVTALALFYELNLSKMANFRRYKSNSKKCAKFIQCFNFFAVWGSIIIIIAVNVIPVTNCINKITFYSSISYLIILAIIFPIISSYSEPKKKEKKQEKSDASNKNQSCGRSLLDIIILIFSIVGFILGIVEIVRGLNVGIENVHPYTSGCANDSDRSQSARDVLNILTNGSLVMATCISILFAVGPNVQKTKRLILFGIVFIILGVCLDIVFFVELGIFAGVWGAVVVGLGLTLYLKFLEAADQGRYGRREYFFG